MQKPSSGYTLTEVLVVLGVVATLLGIALPGYQRATQAIHANGARSGLLESVMVAVNRGALSGTHAVLCPSTDGSLCMVGERWHFGWIVFGDINQNRLRDPDEPVYRVQEKLGDGIRLRSTVGRSRIVFQDNGGNAGSNVTFTLCDGRGASKAVSLILSNAGRLREAPATPENAARTCGQD